jgi:hypothetical protein
MNSTAGAAVSIVGLVCVLVLPFLFSVFLVTLGLKQFLPLVAFVKAFCFSFVAVGVFDGYGLGGWLAFPMLMFSDLFCLPALWLYWLRQDERETGSVSSAGYLLYLAFVGSLDYCVISPFWASL